MDASLRDRAASALPQQVVAYLQDTALRVGGLNVAGFFAAQPDAPAKLAGFAYAAQERAAAERIAGTWDTAMDAALEKVGVPAS